MSYLVRHALGDVAQVADSGPYFLPDIYELDLGPAPNFDALAARADVVGCILKATQGVSYAPPWFSTNWPRVQLAGGSRYGDSWFRGCYHFGTPAASGEDQADFLLAAVDRAGGWDDGDMAPAWDLEGSAWSSAQQIVDVSSQFSDRIKSQLGKTPILYTGATWRQFGITTDAGFSQMWSSHLGLMAPFGWPDEKYALYQYAGDGKLYDPATAVFGYPTSIPGWGGTDMNVVMDGGMPANDIGAVRSILTGGSNMTIPLILGAGAMLLYLLSKYRTGERIL